MTLPKVMKKGIGKPDCVMGDLTGWVGGRTMEDISGEFGVSSISLRPPCRKATSRG